MSLQRDVLAFEPFPLGLHRFRIGEVKRFIERADIVQFKGACERLPGIGVRWLAAFYALDRPDAQPAQSG